jgi:ABC-2 type transport system permease protein
MITNPVGVLALSRREIHRFLSVSFQTLFPPLVTSTLFMFIFGVAIGRRLVLPIEGVSYISFLLPGLMTLHLISSSYENTSFSLFIGRWHNHIQEILLSPLSYLEMVLGLLAGGVTRGVMVCIGVYWLSQGFEITVIAHPLLFLYFLLTISVFFSCAGMMAALWAEDFGMLNLWNIYLIYPLAILGGVFHPTTILPDIVGVISQFNPIFYLVQGMRYSVIGYSDIAVTTACLVSGTMALGFFFLTVLLFRRGYKLRT